MTGLMSKELIIYNASTFIGLKILECQSDDRTSVGQMA